MASSLTGPADIDVTPAPPELRSSCRFCRVRKIKCSGESPCKACTARGGECIRDVRSRLGRPSNKAREGARKRSRVSTNGSSSGDAAPSTSHPPIGLLLDFLFFELFLSNTTQSAFGAALQAFRSSSEVKKLIEEADEIDEQVQTECPASSYAAVPHLFLKEFIEQATYTASAGRLAMRKSTYLPLSLARDSTVNMQPLDSRHGAGWLQQAASTSPWPTQSEAKKLIESWERLHPLACLYTGHLKVYDLIDRSTSWPPTELDAAQETMLLLSLSEAGNTDLRYAAASADLRSLAEDRFRESVYDETIPESQATIASVALALAWNSISHLRPRRGCVYMALASHLAPTPDPAGDKALLTSAVIQALTLWVGMSVQVDIQDTLSNLLGPLRSACRGVERLSIEELEASPLWVLPISCLSLVESIVTGASINASFAQSFDTDLSALDPTLPVPKILYALGSIASLGTLAKVPSVATSHQLASHCLASRPLLQSSNTPSRSQGEMNMASFTSRFGFKFPQIAPVTGYVLASEPLILTIAMMQIEYATKLLDSVCSNIRLSQTNLTSPLVAASAKDVSFVISELIDTLASPSLLPVEQIFLNELRQTLTRLLESLSAYPSSSSTTSTTSSSIFSDISPPSMNTHTNDDMAWIAEMLSNSVGQDANPLPPLSSDILKPSTSISSSAPIEARDLSSLLSTPISQSTSSASVSTSAPSSAPSNFLATSAFSSPFSSSSSSSSNAIPPSSFQPTSSVPSLVFPTAIDDLSLNLDLNLNATVHSTIDVDVDQEALAAFWGELGLLA